MFERYGVEIEISTHAPLAGRDSFFVLLHRKFAISTHAPLAGRDHRHSGRQLRQLISTHAPLAGRDGAKIEKIKVA